MQNHKIAFLFLILICLSSCATKKRIAQIESQPEWVKQKPDITGYFTGVGSANKVGLPSEYIEKARRDALADMAGEISVQISSTSVLHTIETLYGNTDFFEQHIEIVTEDYLEGFKKTDSYEDEKNYWVLYQIDKATYRENKAKRKNSSIQNALAKLQAGNTAKQKADPVEALKFYLQGLTAIKDYMAEETTGTFNGSKVDAGNELFIAMTNLLRSWEIRALVPEITVKRGESPEVPLAFKVLYNGKAVGSVPITFRYSGGYLNNNKLKSNMDGLVYPDIGIIQSKNQMSHVFASIDFNSIAQNATDDLFIRGLVTRKAIKTAVTRVLIDKPGITIYVNEDFCDNNNCLPIFNVFEKNIVDAGYRSDSVEYDYSIKLNIEFLDGEQAGNLTSEYIDGHIAVFNLKGELLWSKDLTRIKGVGNNKEEARKEAYEAFLKKLNLIYLRQGLEAIN